MDRRKFLSGTAAASAGMFLSPESILKDNIVNATGEPAHKIITCNIRVALPEDEEKGVGWSSRKKLCADVIRSQAPDVICLQEVIKIQMDDMRSFFPEFASFGFEGPEMDPIPVGYHWIAKNPILFSRERYELLSGGSFWLSDQPLIGGSKSWGTARARHANWVRLKDIESQKEFRVINTHLDHVSQDSREMQIGLILKESEQYQQEFPQILAGDFNADFRNPVLDIVKESGWTDTYASVHGSHYPNFTGHGFAGKESKSTRGPIDYIFARGNTKANKAQIIIDTDEGRYPSDHFFVSAEVEV